MGAATYEDPEDYPYGPGNPDYERDGRMEEMKPGIHALTEAEYHADPCPAPSLNSSIACVLVERSPFHARASHPRLNPDYEPQEESKFDYGKAAHAVVMEGDNSRIAVIDAEDWRTKAAREAKAAARAQGRIPVLAYQSAQVLHMAAVAREFMETTELAGVLANGRAEQTVIWREDGIWLRSRIDFMSNDRLIVVDYKSTTDASPDTFARQIPRMSYHIQESFYRRAVKAVCGKYPAFFWLAQENVPPFSCSLHRASPSLQAVGNELVEQAIELWRKCLREGLWPSYSATTYTVDAPPWLIDSVASDMLSWGKTLDDLIDLGGQA